jgi:hypothetical protein
MTGQDAVTITPAHIWAVVEFDLGSESLTDEGAADFLTLVHTYLTNHAVKSFTQWGTHRGLVKIRNVVADTFADKLRDILAVNVVPRSYFEMDGHGLEKIRN